VDSKFRLDDKVALVTGASRGLGLGIAQALKDADAMVTGHTLLVDGGWTAW
jgi:NADP-dependent 3-hydroxy acid dehydrogenase YdfG